MDSTKNKILNTATAVVLAFSLTAVGAPVIVGSMPSMAQAAEQLEVTGTITIPQKEVTMTAGTQLDLIESGDVKVEFDPPEAIEGVDYHMNFGVLGGNIGAATVNKRSGIVTANAPGTVTIGVYMIDGPEKPGNQGFPDGPVITEGSLDIKVVAASVDTGAYIADETLQGLAQAVTLQNYVNDGATYTIERSDDAITQYTNDLGVIAKANEALSFKYRQAFGVGSNFDSFVENNSGAIILTGTDGLNASLGNGLTLALQPDAKQAFELTVDDAPLSAGNYTLTFTKDYVAGNGRDMLGADVVFNFCIEEVA